MTDPWPTTTSAPAATTTTTKESLQERTMALIVSALVVKLGMAASRIRRMTWPVSFTLRERLRCSEQRLKNGSHFSSEWSKRAMLSARSMRLNQSRKLEVHKDSTWKLSQGRLSWRSYKTTSKNWDKRASKWSKTFVTSESKIRAFLETMTRMSLIHRSISLPAVKTPWISFKKLYTATQPVAVSSSPSQDIPQTIQFFKTKCMGVWQAVCQGCPLRTTWFHRWTKLWILSHKTNTISAWSGRELWKRRKTAWCLNQSMFHQDDTISLQVKRVWRCRPISLIRRSRKLIVTEKLKADFGSIKSIKLSKNLSVSIKTENSSTECSNTRCPTT